MKFLDMPSLGRLTSMLTDCTLGDQLLNGRIEAFSCKKAGDDKKLSKTLNEKFQKKRKRSRGESMGSISTPRPIAESGGVTASGAAALAMGQPPVATVRPVPVAAAEGSDSTAAAAPKR